MIRAAILTPWATDPTDGSQGPQLMIDYPYTSVGEMFTDVTNQPVDNLTPEPNLYTVETVRTEETMALIRGDARYFILWEEPV